MYLCFSQSSVINLSRFLGKNKTIVTHFRKHVANSIDLLSNFPHFVPGSGFCTPHFRNDCFHVFRCLVHLFLLVFHGLFDGGGFGLDFPEEGLRCIKLSCQSIPVAFVNSRFWRLKVGRKVFLRETITWIWGQRQEERWAANLE